MDIANSVESNIARFKERFAAACGLPELRIGDRIARLPLVQGGMGVGISLSRLAAAVAGEGGIGVIAANAIGMIEPDYYDHHIEADVRALRGEIRKARDLAPGLIGVNIMVAVDCFHRLLETAVEEKADILFLGAGLPIKGIPVAALREANVRVVPIVSSGRAARLIFRAWEKNYNDIPDAVVVEGPLAGGHLGFKPEQIDDPDYRLERLVPEVVDALREFELRWNRQLPVIAGGGIFTGEDAFRIMKLGARGVQLGTRFVATHECDADIRFKQAYVDCRPEDILIIESPVGLPGRAIRSGFLDDVARGVKKFFRCPSRCLASCGAQDARYCISEALDNARQGLLDKGFAFCGANAHRVKAIVSVKELVGELWRGYAMAALVSAVKAEYESASEKFTRKKEEYGTALAATRERLQENVRRMSAENEAKFREESARLGERLARVRTEYESARTRLTELGDDMAELIHGVSSPESFKG